MTVETLARPVPTADDIVARLRAIVGDAHVLEADADTSPYLRERRDLYRG